ncbi:MAG: hypothetical protein GC179_28335 [Anaerolineaceae bacterium]|nr:hypothetical protein [Anaerolineaceae bacterium]
MDGSLVQQYFGKYLLQLDLGFKETGFFSRFLNVHYSPDSLEKRLKTIEHLGLTRSIINEIGHIQNLKELDKRLQNAWAELRFVDQIHREGFKDIHKFTEVADFTATQNSNAYAFQVTRINKSLNDEIVNRNPPEKRSGSAYGTLDAIHTRLDNPLSFYFWNALENKNNKFGKWKERPFIRCIVIVSSDEALQDPMIRHMSCQQISRSAASLVHRNFEELIWLPDLSNGAWFKFPDDPKSTLCMADWKDDPTHSYHLDEMYIHRRTVDLTEF